MTLDLPGSLTIIRRIHSRTFGTGSLANRRITGLIRVLKDRFANSLVNAGQHRMNIYKSSSILFLTSRILYLVDLAKVMIRNIITAPL